MVSFAVEQFGETKGVRNEWHCLLRRISLRRRPRLNQSTIVTSLFLSNGERRCLKLDCGPRVFEIVSARSVEMHALGACVDELELDED
jgi:hypothetical protein